MGKITVKHYLNTNLKPYIIDGDKYYKIYVLIRADTQNTKIKSDVSTNEYTEIEFTKLIENKESELNRSIKEETKIIEFIVNKMNEDNKVFTSALFTEYSNRFKIPIVTLFKSMNSYYDKYKNDPLLDYLWNEMDKSGYFEIVDDLYGLVSENINLIQGLLAINYEIVDLYLVQWFTINLKEQFLNIYKKNKDEKWLLKEVEKLDVEIKRHLKLK